MKPIEGYEGYFVDEQGGVWSKKYHPIQNKNSELRQLKYGIDTMGYPLVILCIKGKRYGKRVHRLVAETFIPNPENKPQVNHINGVKNDCKAVNLEWNTAKENMQHAFDSGLGRKGEKHHQSKLTEAQVMLIRVDTRSQRKIAADYGVAQSQIGAIKNRKTWKNI
jgi:hypothetical protein